MSWKLNLTNETQHRPTNRAGGGRAGPALAKHWSVEGGRRLIEGKQRELKPGAPTSHDVGTQTAGAGGVTRLAMEQVLKHCAVDGSVAGAEVRYVPAGVQLRVPWGVRTAHRVLRSLE